MLYCPGNHDLGNGQGSKDDEMEYVKRYTAGGLVCAACREVVGFRTASVFSLALALPCSRLPVHGRNFVVLESARNVYSPVRSKLWVSQ